MIIDDLVAHSDQWITDVNAVEVILQPFLTSHNKNSCVGMHQKIEEELFALPYSDPTGDIVRNLRQEAGDEGWLPGQIVDEDFDENDDASDGTIDSVLADRSEKTA